MISGRINNGLVFLMPMMGQAVKSKQRQKNAIRTRARSKPLIPSSIVANTAPIILIPIIILVKITPIQLMTLINETTWQQQVRHLGSSGLKVSEFFASMIAKLQNFQIFVLFIVPGCLCVFALYA